MAIFNLRDLYFNSFGIAVLPGQTMGASGGISNFGAGPADLAAGAHTVNLSSGDRYIVTDSNLLDFQSPQTADGHAAASTYSFTVNVNGVLSNTNPTFVPANPGDFAPAAMVFQNGHTAADKVAPLLVNTVNVSKDGSIGSDSIGIYATAKTNVNNSGVISSGGNPASNSAAILFNQYDSGSNLDKVSNVTVNNALAAVIIGETYGIGHDSVGKLTVNNAGRLTGGVTTANNSEGAGAIESRQGTLVLTNAATGFIEGNVGAGWLNTSITNKGSMNGTIHAHMNTEQVDLNNPNSPLTGFIDYNRNGTASSLETGLTGDKHWNLVTETATTIINNGAIFGTEGWFPGDPTVTIALDLTDGKDLVTNTGGISGNIETRAGNDSLTNAATGKIFGDVFLGSSEFYSTFQGGKYALDADTVSNLGLINGRVSTDMGKDVVTNSGEITQQVELGTGDYFAANELGEDADTLTNSGKIGQWVWTGLGDDVVTNSGFIAGYVSTSAWIGRYDSKTATWSFQNDTATANKAFDNDNDKVTNTGTIGTLDGNGGIFTGHGADTVSNTFVVNGDIATGTDFRNGNGNPDAPFTVVPLDLYAEDDKDTVTNSGSVINIFTGLGADTVTNSGYVRGGIYTSVNNGTQCSTTPTLL